jgi:hypothetical protein
VAAQVVQLYDDMWQGEPMRGCHVVTSHWPILVMVIKIMESMGVEPVTSRGYKVLRLHRKACQGVP